MIYAAIEGPCTLIIERDDDPVNPRIDCDPFGHMVCWHRRYSLGDTHSYKTPQDFLHGMQTLLAEQKDIVILPIYLYDHSGLSMSTVPFAGRAPHAAWDSGQVGYIYADRDDIRRDFGEVTPETVKRAGEALESEVRQYDAYLRGDCWGYRTYMHGRETDACWGFLGDIDDIRRDIASHLAPGWDRLVEKLEPYCQSAKEYLYDKILLLSSPQNRSGKEGRTA